jgi:hypothetical protein
MEYETNFALMVCGVVKIDIWVKFHNFLAYRHLIMNLNLITHYLTMI